MSKIFRLYKEGNNTYKNWNESPSFPYNSTSRDTIEDPDGASARNEITSIPSPFARIDLVKTAFREVCRSRQLDGKTIFHKMVSDSLDVGEIFFNIDKFKDKIEIITWEPKKMIDELLHDGNDSHYYVADALRKYLQSDAVTYNFGRVQNIYLLNYKHGPSTLNIIGATSPATAFFCSANKLDYVNDVFFANNDRPFDKDFQPLYKRDFDYVKAWWTLSKSLENFSTLFPELQEYLELTFKALDSQDKKEKLRNVTAASANDFDSIDVQTLQNFNKVEVLGTPIFKKKPVEATNNQFTLAAERKVGGVLPLVLPVESGNSYAELEYVNGPWGKENKAPIVDPQEDLSKRVLPFDGTVRPYLTIGDFLEDTIVRVPHALNAHYFFDGNISRTLEQTSFLLPIKPLYFKYFSLKTLKSLLPDGRKAFELDVLAGESVRVTLRVPIVGNKNIKYIEYRRTYYAEHQAEISATENNGGMKAFDFTGLVMPAKRFQIESEALYIISCISALNSNFRLDFFSEGEMIRDIPMDCRNKGNSGVAYKAETYTIEKKNFDFIRITDPYGCSNLLVADFAEHSNIDNFEFSVDLGTSNTHMEFKKASENTSQSFTYSEDEAQYCRFFQPSFQEIEGTLIQKDLELENDLAEADFLPITLGSESDFHFPARTVLSYAQTTNWQNNLRPFGLLNFNLTYNKRVPLDYNATPMVNIKWSNEENAQAAMQAFINNVMILIRNKVVALNGNIVNTKITWFYPESMSNIRRTTLNTVWNEAYKTYFRPDGNTERISESEAPIRFYFRRYNTVTDLVNVDIGGGTTDIAFSSDGKVNFITSFKFAANSLFEDSFSPMNPNNGIIDAFKTSIFSVLEQNRLTELVNIFQKIDGQPANMASFLFSLKDNSATKGLSAATIDFNRILQNDTQFKIVFIVFYTAIIYHIAQIVKAKNLPIPRHIAFSGNGSKIISIIAADNDILSNFTDTIFREVVGRRGDERVDILGLNQDNNPKEATCKGGLIRSNQEGLEIVRLMLKNANGDLIADSDTYRSLDEAAQAAIVDSVKEFFHFTFDVLPQKFNFDNNFGVGRQSIETAKAVCLKDLPTYLKRGISDSRRDSGDDDNKIEDALSFYPIKGALQSLSDALKK